METKRFTEPLPEDGFINPIPKKDELTRCDNYRAITLLSIAYKLTTYLIYKKVEKIYEEALGEYQCGFRKDRSTTNQLFTIRHLLEKLWEHNITLYHLFIDFKTTYDSIDQSAMWKALKELGMPNEMVQLCKVVTEGRVKVNGGILGIMQIEKGVKQGDGLASIFFNLMLEAAIRRARVNRSATLIHQGAQTLGYDLDIAGRSLKMVKKALKPLKGRQGG